MLKWDGTEITHLLEDENIIIEESIYGDLIYYRFINKKEVKLNQHKKGEKEKEDENIGIVRTSSTSFPCLIDEIKPVFGLQKIGTHWFWQYNKIMILQKARIVDGVVVQELHLNELTYHHHRLEVEVRKIFTFRELLGMSKNHEKSIILRDFEDRILPVSFYEPGMEPAHKGKVIPESIMKKWFDGITIDQCVTKLLEVYDINDMSKKLSILRKDLEGIVLRVDKEQITMVDEILTRIRKRLQYILV